MTLLNTAISVVIPAGKVIVAITGGIGALGLLAISLLADLLRQIMAKG